MKKYFGVFLIGLLLSNLVVFNVRGEERAFLTADEVVKGTNDYCEDFSATFVNDSTEKVIKVVDNDNISTLWSMAYTDEGIMFDATGEEINKTNIDKRFSDSWYLTFIMMGTYKALGYTDTQIDNVSAWLSDKNEAAKLSNYDMYGLEIVAEPYSINYEDNLGTTKLSGDFIRKMRVSFEKANGVSDFRWKIE